MDEQFEYVGFWGRVGAMIIDTLILLVVIIPLLLAVYGEEYFDRTEMIQGPADIFLNYVLPAIAVILFWVYKSATPGKMVISAKIVDAKTGNKPSTGQFIGRYFAYILSSIPLGLGFIWIAFDKKKQGWHDKLAGTVVVRKRNTGSEPVSFES